MLGRRHCANFTGQCPASTFRLPSRPSRTFQAVQLASSLNSLRGSGGGLNPLAKLRAATGFNRLQVLGADQASGRGTALAAGKYISNNIYLEVVTDARGFTATQLEVTLSWALSVLSQAGGSNSASIRVRYRKNY